MSEAGVAKKRGRRIVLAVAVFLPLLVAGLTWAFWGKVEFRRAFEYLGRNEQGLDEYRHHATGLVFVHVPGGEFRMGLSDDWEEVFGNGLFADEAAPIRRASVGEFLIAKYELDPETYRSVMGKPGQVNEYVSARESVSLTLDEANRFCARTGLRFPTQVEWEFACRGGTRTSFAFGGSSSRPPKGDGLVDDKQSNAYGLYDMHGSVWEWCSDRYDGEDASEDVPEYIIRGGLYYYFDERAPSWMRGSSPVEESHGLRPVFGPIP